MKSPLHQAPWAPLPRTEIPERAEQKRSITAINRWYDTQMFRRQPRAAAASDFHNWGYWELNTRNREEACANLMEMLLAFIPEKKGTILDVACGKGATTRYLLNYYRPEDVTGSNISAKQLQRCKVNVPDCKFILMNAVELAFADNSFDNVICVESAFHFNTRQKFLKEAYRVLKPGGRLVLSDILATWWSEAAASTLTAKNYVRDLGVYRRLYHGVGFEHLQVVDATLECWIRFYRRSSRFLRASLRRNKIDWATFRRMQSRLHRRNLAVRYYLLVCAWKPRPVWYTDFAPETQQQPRERTSAIRLLW